jgi:hypothetical protein
LKKVLVSAEANPSAAGFAFLFQHKPGRFSTTVFLFNILAIVVMGILVWRRGRDQRVGSITAAHWLRIAGLMPLGLEVAILLFFGFGEMGSGDLSGMSHLLPAVPIVLLGILAWLRPLEGGIALFAGGALFVIIFLTSLAASTPGPGITGISSAMMIMAVPQLVSGGLFFIAGLLGKRASFQGAPH